MRVVGHNILVKKLTEKIGGIFVTAYGNLGYCHCEVVAVGTPAYHMPSDSYMPMNVKVGDRTLINQGVMEEYIIQNKDGVKETFYWVPAVEATMILADNEDI